MTHIDGDRSSNYQPFREPPLEIPRHVSLRRRRILRWLGASCVMLFILGTISGAVLAHQIMSARSQLEAAAGNLGDLRSQLQSGNRMETPVTYELLRDNTSAAKDTATGPLWKAASAIPFLGPNLDAVTEVAVSANEVALGAVGPLLKEYNSLDGGALAPAGGKIDITPIQKATPVLMSAEESVRLSHERLASIDLSGLLSQVADPIRSVAEQLQKASITLESISSATELLPPMLGADAPRTYLIMVQNGAEARATGGIPGAIVILTVEDGRISLGEQSSAAALGSFLPPLEVDPEQVALYTSRLGTQMQNVNLTPDFPTAAETAKQMWEQRHSNQTIDGVLALDPVVLSHLLSATGSVDLIDSQVLSSVGETSLPSSLTAENVIPTLLSDVYRQFDDPEAQDAYFAAVADRIFTSFTEGRANGTQILKALTASTREGRLYLWSSHEQEQDIIASTPLQGSVSGPESGDTAFGVYFNDGTGAKMDYYVKRSVQLIQACAVGDYGRYTARVTVTNNAPMDAASSLPNYVTGGGVFGVEPGRVRTNYVMYGPAQSFVESARVNGETVAVGSGKHGQRPVGTVTQELGPGETAVIEVDFTRVVQDSEPHLDVTPTVQPLTDVVLPAIREDPCQ